MWQISLFPSLDKSIVRRGVGVLTGRIKWLLKKVGAALQELYLGLSPGHVKKKKKLSELQNIQQMSVYNQYLYHLKKWQEDKTYLPPTFRKHYQHLWKSRCPMGPSLSISPPHQPKETTILILCSSFPYYNYCTCVISLNDTWFCFACFEPFNFFSLTVEIHPHW